MFVNKTLKTLSHCLMSSLKTSPIGVFSECLDDNRWLTSLGQRLAEVLTRSGLMVSEDMAFVDSLIDSQNEFQSNNESKHSIALNKHVLIGVSVTSALIWLESSLTYRPLLGSLVCGISCRLSSLIYQSITKSYLKRQLIQKSIDLSKRLTKESLLFKKYFKLIEDYEVIEVNGKRLISISQMKDKFRSFCWICFLSFRQITCDLRLKFAINTELDEESNYLCCLPIDTFDRFLAEDKKDITLSLLKSLMQLKRLQQSECFRRIICLFMAFCYQNQRSDNQSESICKTVISIFDQLIQDCDQRYPELLSEYNCAKTLWVSCEKSLVPFRDLRHTNETIETLNLLNINRNIRKHLFMALNILDDCDYLIEDGIVCNEIRDNFKENLNLMNNQIKCLSDLVIDLEKLLKIEELKESNIKSVLSPRLDNENPIPSTNSSKFEEYIVKDQVFEAFVTEDENDISVEPEDEYLCRNTTKTIKTADTSHSLLTELKTALKSKAVERKRREAEALGLPFDEISSDESSDRSEDSETETESSHTLPERLPMNRVFAKTFNENDLIGGQKMFGFESQLATIAAQKASLFAANNQTESFGDQSDEETEESSAV